MSLDTPAPSTPAITEARRQAEICNACRYCEGFCAVFPAMFDKRLFANGDITQLANLCHNCRGCYYSCQYTSPHEFELNLPKALAEVQVESWDRFAWPRGISVAVQSNGLAIAAVLVLGIAALFFAQSTLSPDGGEGFYAVLAHSVMTAIFMPAFLFPLAVLAIGLRRYWHETDGRPVKFRHLREAAMNAAKMRNLSGGQEQGCNYEKGDRYSQARRYAHQATMWGFLLCFAATVSGTVMHYGFALHAPYSLISLPKILGVPGGVLLTLGTVKLAWLKTRADSNLGAGTTRGGEMAFVFLLGLTGASGLALYASTGTTLVPSLMGLHLGAVLALFLLTPYSKMAHGFYRLAALVRDAQRRSAKTD